MDYENVLGESKFPTYEQLKSGLIRLIEEGKITREDAGMILPELRESEDEQTRKQLIDFISNIKAKSESGRNSLAVRKGDAEMCDAFLTWLKKQKEQKPINNSTREKIISRATSEKQVVLVSESSGKAEIGWDTRSLEDAKKLLEYGLAFINKQLGVKPAEWSEEDEKHINNILDIIDCWKATTHFVSYQGGTIDADIKWLKSLRPQPQQNMSISFMLYLDEIRPEGKMCLSNGECNDIEDAFKKQDWPRLFKYINKYQPHWKPSEEQIETLGQWLKDKQFDGDSRYVYPIFESLYEQLQRL